MQNEAKNQEGFEEIFGFGQKRNCRLSFHALFRKSETHLHSRHCYFWKSFEHNFLIYFSIFKMFGRDKPIPIAIGRGNSPPRVQMIEKTSEMRWFFYANDMKNLLE